MSDCPSTSIAYIGIGSNLAGEQANSLEQVLAAISALEQHSDITQVTVSPWYGSTAVGPGEQPDYINGVAEIHTTLEPLH